MTKTDADCGGILDKMETTNLYGNVFRLRTIGGPIGEDSDRPCLRGQPQQSDMNILQHDERVTERRFTHPHYIEVEVRLLRYMLSRLCQVLEAVHWRANPNTLAPVTHELVEGDGRHHRIIPIRPNLLRDRRCFSIVGFFGQRRFDADGSGIASRDQMLFDEMEQHEGLLSYSSLELTNADYGNCVVFADEVAKQHWGYSRNHQVAAQVLSPGYYHSVRLYNGVLNAPLMEPHKLRLTVAKYYDYSAEMPWSAIRHIG